MSDNEHSKEAAAAPAPATKRSKAVGVAAALAGLLAAVVGLVGVLTTTGEVDLLYVLLFAGGMLVSVLGLRRLRKIRRG